MISTALRPALYTQLVYAALVISWQLIGLALLSAGRPALGPTASWAVVLQAVVLAGLFVITLQRWPLLFLCLSMLTALAAALTIWNAFTADPNLWHSDLRRYLGVAVNSVGLIGLGVAFLGVRRWRLDDPSCAESSTSRRSRERSP